MRLGASDETKALRLAAARQQFETAVPYLFEVTGLTADEERYGMGASRRSPLDFDNLLAKRILELEARIKQLEAATGVQKPTTLAPPLGDDALDETRFE